MMLSEITLCLVFYEMVFYHDIRKKEGGQISQSRRSKNSTVIHKTYTNVIETNRILPKGT